MLWHHQVSVEDGIRGDVDHGWLEYVHGEQLYICHEDYKH